MHPLLRSAKYLFIIGFIWSPVILTMVLLQSRLTGLFWADSVLLVGPPMGIELFAVLSTWYICRSLPLRDHNPVDLITRHFFSASAYTAVWMLLILLYSEILGEVYPAKVWPEFFDQTIPLFILTGYILYFLGCLLHYLIMAREEVRLTQEQSLQYQLQASRAQFQSLRATIHPHFMFNSLTALSTLTRTNAKLAQTLCLKLADFLRYSLKYGFRDWVTLQDEIQHMNDYLAVEQIRLGDRLHLKIQIDKSCRKVQVIPFILLPLVENAVKHGIQELVEGGTLRISVKKKLEFITIEVENPFPEKVERRISSGYGLVSLNERLNSVYGAEAHLIAGKNSQKYLAKMQIPIKN